MQCVYLHSPGVHCCRYCRCCRFADGMNNASYSIRDNPGEVYVWYVLALMSMCACVQICKWQVRVQADIRIHTSGHKCTRLFLVCFLQLYSRSSVSSALRPRNAATPCLSVSASCAAVFNSVSFSDGCRCEQNVFRTSFHEYIIYNVYVWRLPRITFCCVEESDRKRQANAKPVRMTVVWGIDAVRH